jgi:hypothetical protein
MIFHFNLLCSEHLSEVFNNYKPWKFVFVVELNFFKLNNIIHLRNFLFLIMVSLWDYLKLLILIKWFNRSIYISMGTQIRNILIWKFIIILILISFLNLNKFHTFHKFCINLDIFIRLHPTFNVWIIYVISFFIYFFIFFPGYFTWNQWFSWTFLINFLYLIFRAILLK